MLLTGYDVANRLKDDLATGNCLECKANLFFRDTRPVDDVASQFIASNQTTINLAVALLLGAIVGLERGWDAREDRKSTRLNSSHVRISYAVFCLKKKKTYKTRYTAQYI